MHNDPHFKNEGVNQFRRRMQARRERLARSGLLTGITLLALLGVLGAVWMAHIGGRFHRYTTAQETPELATPAVRPGGQDIIHLERSERMGSISPEFTSATLLPGDGMLLLQTTLSLPGRGDVPLILGTMESKLSPASGSAQGAAFVATEQRREGGVWSAPIELIAGRPSKQQNSEILPGGSRAIAYFSADPSGDTASAQTGIETTVSTSLTSRGLDVTMSARNASDVPRAVTLRWEPRFLTPRTGLFLTSPQQDAGSAPAHISEEVVGTRDLDRTYADLKHSYLNAGPEVRLRNQADGYTLHLTALTPSIRSLHLQATTGGNAILVAFSTAGGERGEGSRTTIAPGETLQWRVRVEATANASNTPTTP